MNVLILRLVLELVISHQAAQALEQASVKVVHPVLTMHGHMANGHGSQAPPRNVDQLVDGHWPISMGGFDRPILRGCSEVFQQYRSKHPVILGQNFDQQVEDPLKTSVKRGLRPQNFDPSMSLRALQMAIRVLSMAVSTGRWTLHSSASAMKQIH
jgi:hypothetical protein